MKLRRKERENWRKKEELWKIESGRR